MQAFHLPRQVATGLQCYVAAHGKTDEIDRSTLDRLVYRGCNVLVVSRADNGLIDRKSIETEHAQALLPRGAIEQRSLNGRTGYAVEIHDRLTRRMSVFSEIHAYFQPVEVLCSITNRPTMRWG